MTYPIGWQSILCFTVTIHLPGSTTKNKEWKRSGKIRLLIRTFCKKVNWQLFVDGEVNIVKFSLCRSWGNYLAISTAWARGKKLFQENLNSFYFFASTCHVSKNRYIESAVRSHNQSINYTWHKRKTDCVNVLLRKKGSLSRLKISQKRPIAANQIQNVKYLCYDRLTSSHMTNQSAPSTLSPKQINATRDSRMYDNMSCVITFETTLQAVESYLQNITKRW